MQQVVLLMLLAGGSVHRCAVCTGRDRRTVRRWRDWLLERSETFSFFLRSRLPGFGRVASRTAQCGPACRVVWEAMPLS